MLLTVGSSVPVGAVAHFENSTGSCYINPTTTSLSCSSDSRLKTNVVPLDSKDGLTAVLKINPVTYNWKSEAGGSAAHTGFIAQDVQPILPDLISQGPDGYYTLNYAGLTPYLVKAIQEVATITGVFKDNLVAWLGSASNGIGDMFVSTLHSHKSVTDELCVSDSANDNSPLCLTKPQLAALLSQSGSSQESNSGSTGNENSTTPAAESTPPVISINGDNPAQQMTPANGNIPPATNDNSAPNTTEASSQ
jgi:hypothetical protein